jgi:hypothetical protein
MRICLVASILLLQVLFSHESRAQNGDPGLIQEVTAVRNAAMRDLAALRDYSWEEETTVSIKGSVKSTSSKFCRYVAGELTKTPLLPGQEGTPASAISKRHLVRQKADMEDYVRRAINTIHDYVPMKPDRLQYLLENGQVLMGLSGTNKYEFRIRSYFQEGDTLVFTYDPSTKALVRINIVSNLGTPKDPVTVEAAFEALPDGVNHLATVVLVAKSRNVQVNLRNLNYKKLAN